MDKSKQFEQFRKEYNTFKFKKYTIDEDNEAINIQYDFEITDLTEFKPTIKILKKDMKLKKISNNKYIENMVFHIGLIELISYWKCTCSPNVIIECGYLNNEQINWFKKLYFYGLGELFFTNNIKTNIDDFMNIKCYGEKIELDDNREIDEDFKGYIIPIGGGKDSIVTLETLNLDKEQNYTLIINPKPVTLKCAEIAGFENDNIIEVYRKIDKNLIDLNGKDFINGHTPFSSLLAFLSYFIAYITEKKYIALSNESSANESNVVGEKINHQYSKSYEFENDFAEYSKKYLKKPIKYFSFLRPLNELQIAKIFSKHEKYHKIFKSCNVGSKEKEWKWCCKCPKCLFVFIILSPFLYKEKLINIFNKDLFEDKELLNTFIELIGHGETKPFECVGTFEEVNFAISKTIDNLEKEKKDLPYLFHFYKENYQMSDLSIDILKRYNEENNLNKEQNDILKEEVFND